MPLVELVVVIGIIAVLFALLVPAVQRVRESANRTQCQTNLKQMGLALQQYYGVCGRFPAAYKAPTTAAALPGWGWGTALLPYLEQDSLWKALDPRNNDFGRGANPAEAIPLTQVELRMFRCPSDGGAPLNSRRYNHATSNYRAVAGTDVKHPKWFTANADFGGVMFQNSATTVSAIADGTSNTVALGECSLSEKYWGAIWVGMTGRSSDGARVSDVMWWLDQTASTINGSSPQAFSSSHAHGAYFLFCDGSVHFFDESVDMTVFRFLAGRSDGVVVNPLD